MAVHLVPSLGSKRLDAITSEDVQRLKGHLKDKAPKTVNNVLTVVNNGGEPSVPHRLHMGWSEALQKTEARVGHHRHVRHPRAIPLSSTR